ncbi:MAG TPA: hypothetical protein VLH09_12900 [Bryobacteraceae bacterium]|nr:hypothetical protein [Bryobacteraceae bacterium]
MLEFLHQHAASVTGMISGFDRLRLRGTLRMLANLIGMDRFLSYTGHRLKDFGDYALCTSRRVRRQALDVVESAGRPVVHLDSPTAGKEQIALEIAARDGVQEGIIAAITAVESCPGYGVRSDRSRGLLELYARPRRCQHIYTYRIDPRFGLCYTRQQTWFPFNIHVGLNGREWLARQMDAAGIDYRRADNCFTWIQDPGAAQELLDQQVSFGWGKAFAEWSREINPALPGIVGGYNIPYYWSIDQSEWASDVMFKSADELGRLFPSLIRHGMESFASPEVTRFLGRPVPAAGGVNPRFSGEVTTDLKRRPEGMRIKHRVNHNSIKMYDKAGSVLRVETTLNDMRDMKAPRVVEGKVVWRPMRKGVADVQRRAEVSQKSNERYLEGLAAVQTPTPLKELTQGLGRAVTWNGRRARGLNLLGQEDGDLLAAAGRGEFLINGFRNRDLQGLLFKRDAADPAEQRRRSGQVTRKLRLLRAHGLIQKVPHTHRYMVSEKGRRVIAALHAAKEADIRKLTAAA